MKKFICLILALILALSLGITASATSGTETVSISYRGITVVLNGAVLTPTDANGNAVEPFIMDGSTYLPLRAIAGALGLEVAWDNASSTVTLTTSESSTLTVTTVHSYDRAGETPISVTVRRENYSGGLLISAETWDSEGQMLSTESYVYNSEGLLQSHSVDAAGEDADRLTTYTYENGLLSRVDTYTGRSTPGVHSIRGFYSYDEAGRLINLYVHYPNASWDNTDYSYDSAGLLLRSDSHGYDILRNSHYSSYTDYFYDSSGTLLRSEAPGSATEYFYGSDGRLAKTVTRHHDGTFTVVSYAYSH